MRAYARKWGNSLAVRIPQALAEEIRLAADEPVDLRVEGGRLLLTPVVEDTPSLDALLAGVTEENVHAEVDFGESQGLEAW